MMESGWEPELWREGRLATRVVGDLNVKLTSPVLTHFRVYALYGLVCGGLTDKYKEPLKVTDHVNKLKCCVVGFFYPHFTIYYI